MSREDAEYALDAFSKKVGTAPLRFDQSGTALLAFGEKQELIFYFDDQTRQLQMWSPLNDLVLSGAVDFDCVLMQHLLRKNFPTVALNGAYFAVGDEIGVVLLGRSIAVDVQNTDAFSDMVTTFAQQVLTITATITKEVSDAFTAHKTPDAPDHGTPIIKV